MISKLKLFPNLKKPVKNVTPIVQTQNKTKSVLGVRITLCGVRAGCSITAIGETIFSEGSPLITLTAHKELPTLSFKKTFNLAPSRILDASSHY